MKKHHLLPLCFCLLASTACQQQQDNKLIGRQAPMTGTVIASVNGINIYDREIQLLQDARQHIQQPISREAAIEELINVEIMRQQAITDGIHLDQDIAAQMNRQSIQVLVTESIRRYMKTQVFSEQDLFAEYNEYTSQLSGQEYKVRHILSKTKAEADNNIDDLNQGTPFTELAQKRSSDTSSDKGGELGWITPKNLVKPLADALVAIKPGEYTHQPIQTQFGWHILLLEETRSTTPPDINSIKKELQTRIMNKRIKAYVEQQHQKARIVFSKTTPATAEKPATNQQPKSSDKTAG